MLDTDVRNFLQKCGLRLNTDAGQHFLIDQDTLDEIVSAAELQQSDHVWEVGPGIGVLTRELVKRVGRVTSIEIDPRFPPLIRTFVGDTSMPEIIVGNALHIPLPADAPYKVVANIPYHITSPLLHHLLLETSIIPTSMTLLLQREVAENICSKGSSSILTVLVRLFGNPRLLRLVPPESFLPPPKVDSAVIHIQCLEKPMVDNKTVRKILMLAKHAMSKRRKMLSNSIGALPGGMEALHKVGIEHTRRPQTLLIDEWIQLETALRHIP